MNGTISKESGEFWINYRYPLHDRPVLCGTRWRVTGARATGGLAPELADGLTVTHADADRWQAYREGAYLVLSSEKMGERLPDQPIGAPKVRKGIDVRYYCGRWEKYSKRDGWLAA